MYVLVIYYKHYNKGEHNIMSGIVGQNLGRGSGLIKAGAIDDDSVTLAKMAGLARGNLIYGDTSGDPAALAVGGADEVLTHDGTDFDWAAAGGGTALTGSTNNTVTTVTGADAIQGEANLTFDGTDLTVGTGDIVFSTAGKGICLGVTSNTDANTLDDYEEGTWTPDFQGTGGSAGASATSAGQATYTKIGRLVTFQADCAWTNQGSWTGNAVLTGLPFAAVGNASGCFFGVVKYIDLKGGTWLTGQITTTGQIVNFVEGNDDGDDIKLVVGAWDNGSNSLNINGRYIT